MIKQRHTKQNGKHLNRCATESCQSNVGLTMTVDSAGKVYFLCRCCREILNHLQAGIYRVSRMPDARKAG